MCGKKDADGVTKAVFVDVAAGKTNALESKVLLAIVSTNSILLTEVNIIYLNGLAFGLLNKVDGCLICETR